MERKTFSVMFYIRKTRTNKKGEAPVLMRLTVNGVRAETNIKKSINPELWDSIKGKAIEKTKNACELNLYIEALRAKITHIQRDMEIDGIEYVTAQMILDRWLGKNMPHRHTILEVFRDHNEKCRALSGLDFSSETVKRYETCYRHTEAFIKNTYGKNDIFLDELSRQFIDDFEFYFKAVKHCNHNSTVKYLKNFKKIVKIAIRNEWLIKDPFADKKFSYQPVERDFLDSDELIKLIQKNLAVPRLQTVKDIFVFCCFTGLAFTDIKQLTPDHICIDPNGAKWIRISRQKTKNMCNIPLLDTPAIIMEKYKKHPYCVEHNVILPVPSNQITT